MDEGAAGGVGQRVAALRKLLGLKQHQLATAAHVSMSLVKKVEAGHAPASPSFTAACAKAFGVEVTVLTGQPYEELTVDTRQDFAGIPELRRALDRYDAPEVDGPVWDAVRLRAALDEGEALRRRGRYTLMTERLPLLLQHLYANLAESSTADATEAAHALLGDAYSLVAAIAYRFGYLDLTALARDRMSHSARRSGDPLRVAVAQFFRSTLQLHRGDYDLGMRCVDRALALAGEQGTPEGLAVVAQLHLRQAIFEARRGNGREADSHIDEARGLVARGVPAYPYFQVSSNRANVEIHSVAVPVEMSDGTTAVARAERTHLPVEGLKEDATRIGHHHIDVARAWVLHGDREKALRSLYTARAVSPQQTRYHPAVRETLHAIAAADRRATDSLAGFARWAGVKV
ncbi:helix-turn-helix domain-containing protein [Saccharothrix lopnurensis]|uniref:Helix-turn-helix domain-containing protein n=1 Tax=Saccharothrix lopnurensis TaxID=1670621 RepID=A0ABW1PCC0_9PSEU